MMVDRARIEQRGGGANSEWPLASVSGWGLPISWRSEARALGLALMAAAVAISQSAQGGTILGIETTLIDSN